MGTHRPLPRRSRSPGCRPPPAAGLPALGSSLCGRGRESQAGGREGADAAPEREPVPRVLSRGPCCNGDGQGQARSSPRPAPDRAPRPAAQTPAARSVPAPAPRGLSPTGDLGASAAPASSGPGPGALRHRSRRRSRRHLRGRLRLCRRLCPRSGRDPCPGPDLSPDPSRGPADLAHVPGPGPGGPAVGTMLPSSIQISGEPLSGAEVRDICRGLRDNAVRLLSLRGCRLCDRDFGRICRALAGATSLAQLNLNLGVVSSPSRIKQLAEALRTNRSIQSLFLHGSPLTDAGLALLNPALALHPALVALDLGDCMLGDEAINLICGLLPPDGAKSGDHVAGMLAVAVASSRTLEVLDLEGTGLTNQSAQTLLDMVENYPTALRSLVLAENSISPELQQQICDLLSEGEEEEEVAGGSGDTQEGVRGREPAAHQRGSSSWMCPSDPSSQMVLMTSGLGDSLLAETEM
ncbi:leucine-rich repeat-containing protein 73 isoform X2 [Rhinolophus sinicus]|uniref:leucine-rich repeat-containing protein 73 isoform X2 n=1 Tax=Rhinolophus sinicus TaxID=89399 RepID=UPI003D7A5697